MKYIVVYVNKSDGFRMYQGGPGLDVNAGVRVENKAVLFKKDALRFDTAEEAQPHLQCNDRWYAHIEMVEP